MKIEDLWNKGIIDARLKIEPLALNCGKFLKTVLFAEILNVWFIQTHKNVTKWGRNVCIISVCFLISPYLMLKTSCLFVSSSSQDSKIHLTPTQSSKSQLFFSPLLFPPLSLLCCALSAPQYQFFYLFPFLLYFITSVCDNYRS